MNKKLRILLGICLVVMVCVPMVSAALQFPIKKNSYNRPFLEQLKVAKDIPYTFGNNKISDGMPPLKLSDSSGDTWRAEISVLVTDIPNPEITHSFLGGSWAPRIWRPGTISSSDIYITEDEAIAIALAQYPDIILTEPITATLEQINAADNPQAKNPCWVVEIVGRNNNSYWSQLNQDLEIEIPISERFIIAPACGGITYVDAVTGDIIFKDIAISSHFTFE